MLLTSSAIADGEMIPRRYTCDGANLSPPLEWRPGPRGTLSFTLLCDDPDAPMGTWHHWAVYDIGSERRGLAEGVPQRPAGEEYKQAINDFRRFGYGGPCPPQGRPPHRYRFRLLALNTAHLTLARDPTCREVEHEARKHLVAETTLAGLYGR